MQSEQAVRCCDCAYCQDGMCAVTGAEVKPLETCDLAKEAEDGDEL